MNEAYNAESARGYDPLTEEERETMTEEQIKKWEDRIKDSLLRRDDTLGGLINALRSTLSEPITVNGRHTPWQALVYLLGNILRKVCYI